MDSRFEKEELTWQSSDKVIHVNNARQSYMRSVLCNTI